MIDGHQLAGNRLQMPPQALANFLHALKQSTATEQVRAEQQHQQAGQYQSHRHGGAGKLCQEGAAEQACQCAQGAVGADAAQPE